MTKHFPLFALTVSASLAQAHDGHGLPGLSHWHATDVALLLAAVGAIGWWLLHRSK